MTTAVTPSRPRASRPVAPIALTVIAVLLVVILAFVVWASSPFTAEAAPLSTVTSNAAISETETADAVVLTPKSGATGIGLVFIAGARVEPAAYAYKLSGLVEAGVTVVIARPLLNFAIIDPRPLSTFTALVPGVDLWYVGGHSLGGVRACQYAADAAAAGSDEVAGVIFLGSYCSADLSSTDVPVLSIGASNDGLSTPAKIADNAHLLPASARFDEIDGANHASFGDYGVQPGDGTATASDSTVRDELTADVFAFLNDNANGSAFYTE